MRTPTAVGLPARSFTWPAALSAVLADAAQPRLVYQPVVDLARGVVAGYEVLSRFDSPLQAGPDRWFAAALAAGCGATLEARVVRRALEERAQLRSGRFLTVNVSPQLLASPEVTAVLAEAGDLTGVVLELTEHVAFDDLDDLARSLARWRAAGAAVALDDAGSGYAGLKQLSVLRPDIVKLDQSLVQHVDRDPIKLALAELLGSFAGRLDACLLAEGVERQEELDTFAGLGVPLAQGYLLGRPAAAPAELGIGVGCHLVGHAQGRAASDRVGNLMETATTAASEASALPLLGQTPGSVVVVLDSAGTAKRLVVRGDEQCVQIRDVSLTVLAGESVRDVVTRAVTRPYVCRFDPIATAEESGMFIGLVRLERASLALAAPPHVNRSTEEFS